MNHGLARRVCTRLLALGMGVSIAVVLFAGAQAQAETVAPQPSPAIVPEAGYEDALVQLAIRGITNRMEDPYFARATLATRAQVAVYLARALQLAGHQSWGFSDVGAAQWGYEEIGELHAAGIMGGATPVAFSPDGLVSREQAAALIVAALRYAAADKQTAITGFLTPYQIDSWLAGFQDWNLIDPRYSESVAMAYRLGLFDLPAGGWLLPRLGVTHQELLGMLERAFVQPLAERAAGPTAIDEMEAIKAYPKLSSGSTGTLVVLLQQRLNALHYPCGEPDGKYSSQTRDAVLAFEKYARLKRTGYVDGPVWEALFSASPAVPVYHGDAGRRVEVDLSRQIMMLIEDNQVVMTIHVSTGKLGTPTGSWHTRTLSHGWRPTSLGPIYSPSYFMAKNAIHGYPSVPTYPASHGCVRTPIWIQDEIIDELEMGELVQVFYNKAKPAN